jgi:hypothetical protein
LYKNLKFEAFIELGELVVIFINGEEIYFLLSSGHGQKKAGRSTGRGLQFPSRKSSLNCQLCLDDLKPDKLTALFERLSPNKSPA